MSFQCGRRCFRRLGRDRIGGRFGVFRVQSCEERGESRLLRVIHAPFILGRTGERSVRWYSHKRFHQEA
jgi:hypothetical protein